VASPDEPPELDELYDEQTLAALDRGAVRSGGHWRPPSARPGLAGVMLAGSALALRDLLETEPDTDAVVEFRPEDGDPAPRWVTFVYVPGAPRASRIVVRPWLAPPSILLAEPRS
jgi:hypothetical protein